MQILRLRGKIQRQKSKTLHWISKLETIYQSKHDFSSCSESESSEDEGDEVSQSGISADLRCVRYRKEYAYPYSTQLKELQIFTFASSAPITALRTSSGKHNLRQFWYIPLSIPQVHESTSPASSWTSSFLLHFVSTGTYCGPEQQVCSWVHGWEISDMAANYCAGAKRIYGLYDSDGPCEATTHCRLLEERHDIPLLTYCK